MSSSLEAAAVTAHFAVTAERCPQLLCRLLGLIAQQNRLVDSAEITTSARSLRVTLRIGAIDRQRAEVLAWKMRALVRVRTVRLRLVKPGSAPPRG